MISLPWETCLMVLLQTSLSLSIVLAFVLLTRSLAMRKLGASFTYALWILPGLRLCLPGFGIDLFSGMWPKQAFTDATAVSAGPVGSVVTEVSGIQPIMDEVGPWHAFADLGIAPFILGIWALGLVGLVIYQVLQHRQFLIDVKRNSVGISPSLLALSTKLRGKLGLQCDPKICVSSFCSGPMVTGLWRPLIIVPTHFEARFSYEEQELALTHEMMHVKRGDLWALQVASWVTAFQWFNPLAWRALRYLRLDQEAACDASVLKNTATSPYLYGSTLVKAATMQAGFTPKRMVQLSFARMLKMRLKALQTPVLSPAKMRINGALLVLCCSTLLFFTGFGYGDAEKVPDLSIGEPSSNMNHRDLLTAPIDSKPMKGFNKIELEQAVKIIELQPDGFMDDKERRAFELSVEQEGANPWAPHPSAEARDRFEKAAERAK